MSNRVDSGEIIAARRGAIEARSLIRVRASAMRVCLSLGIMSKSFPYSMRISVIQLMLPSSSSWSLLASTAAAVVVRKRGVRCGPPSLATFDDDVANPWKCDFFLPTNMVREGP